MPFRILIADDDPNLRDLFRATILRFEPSWVVEIAGDGREALDLLCQGHFDVAVLDVQMPCLDGLEVLREAKKRGIQTDVIILTGYGDVEKSVQAMKEGARDFLQKPIRPDKLVAVVRKALESHFPSHVVAARLDAYLKEFASRPSLNLNDLRKDFHLSRSHIARLFREHFNTTFERRLSLHRVQMAKRLIETTDKPLYDIAEQCGFRDQARLSKVFRRVEGITPQKYREMGRHRGKNET
jgi:YesN/AraC family two-component response regulator